jgi:hypothetical protein
VKSALLASLHFITLPTPVYYSSDCKIKTLGQGYSLIISYVVRAEAVLSTSVLALPTAKSREVQNTEEEKRVLELCANEGV